MNQSIRIGGCTLIKVLGQGGMGIVYLARQEKLNREVVVKVLRPFAIDNEALKERFLRESRIVGRLNHKNIVPVYDVGEEEGSFFIIMKYVPGIPLNKFIESFSDRNRSTLKMSDIVESMIKLVESGLATTVSFDGKTPTEFFCNLIIKVADAVYYAHDNGVIHRDIKPSNIIIEPNGNPILLDFGLSHDEVEKNLTVTGEYLGTPIYSAPETFLKNQIYDNKQLDVYSLGVTLYELLTGKLPYEGESIYEIYSNIKNREPVRPKIRWQHIPKDLEKIINTSICKYSGLRYQSIDELSNDLVAFLNYRPILAKSPSKIKVFIYFVRRRKFRIITFFLLTLIVGSSVGFYFYQKNREIKKFTFEIQELVERGQVDDAISVLKDATKKYPDEAKLWTYLGQFQLSSGDYEDAIINFKNALKLRDSEDDYSSLATAFLYAGDLDEASDTLKKVFQRNSKPKDSIFSKSGNKPQVEIFRLYGQKLRASIPYGWIRKPVEERFSKEVIATYMGVPKASKDFFISPVIVFAHLNTGHGLEDAYIFSSKC